jgi:purine nucleosidase
VIIEEAHRRPGEITLVTLGPATNLAVAILREPELPLLLRRWVLMGGSYRSPGNTAPTTEWNASVDPDALKACIDAFGEPSVVERRASAGMPGLPLALGLDVTERAKLLPDHLAALARRAGSRPDASRDERAGSGGTSSAGSTATHPVVRYLDDALRFYMEFHSRFDGFYGAFIHDPLAVAAALDSSLIRTEEVAVDVELSGTLTTGETVADWRRAWGRPPTLAVAVEADVATFFARFVERVGGLAERIGPA